jgi:hypothetical protein
MTCAVALSIVFWVTNVHVNSVLLLGSQTIKLGNWVIKHGVDGGFVVYTKLKCRFDRATIQTWEDDPLFLTAGYPRPAGTTAAVSSSLRCRGALRGSRGLPC